MTVRWRFTSRSDGDLCVALAPDELEGRRRAVAPLPWTWLDQVHGTDVVAVSAPGDGAGRRADAAVTDVVGAVLAVHTADCAPVLLQGTCEGRPVVGAAHAGWRGLVGGVLGATVQAMCSLGAASISWRLGPCISAAAYEFGDDDLDQLVERFGPTVRSRTAAGRPALDLRAGVRAALGELDVIEAQPDAAVPCTALDPGWFSWRRDRTPERQAGVIWIDDASSSDDWHRGA